MSITGFECCKNQFNFADLCAETDLFAKLPVVFTSAAHIPSDVSLLIIPSRGMSTEYWTGPNVESPTGNFLNAQETVVGGAKYFYTWSGGGWSLATDVMFRSAVQTVVYYQDYYVKVRINGSTPTNLGSLDASVTSLRVSGDGSTFFKLSGDQWYIWSKATNSTAWSWTSMGSPYIGASFDGKYTCSAIWSGAFLYISMHSDLVTWRGSIYLPGQSGIVPYLTIIDQTVFATVDTKVYSIGSTKSASDMLSTAAPCTGIWSDTKTIWVATANRTYMSIDLGWSWIVQEGVRAVNCGLYVRPSGFDLATVSDAKFQDDVQYPLKLTNRGLLTSADGWANVFELKDGTWQNGSQVQDNDAFTVIDRNTRYATSPNGLFLLDNPPNGDVILYFNVWKTAKFQEWCTSNSCDACLARYCNLVQDPDCQTGSVGPIPVTPTPQPTPTTPSKPFPTWIIGLIVGLVLVIGVVVAVVVKRSK